MGLRREQDLQLLDMSHNTYTFQYFVPGDDFPGVHEAIVGALDARIALGTDSAAVLEHLQQIRDATQQVIDDHNNPPQEP